MWSVGRLLLSRVPRLLQTIPACGVRETHGILVLEGLLSLALLLLGLCVLLALDGLLEVYWKEVEVTGVVSQGRITRRLAQLQNFCVLFIAVFGSGQGCSQPYVHVGVVFAPPLPPPPIMTAIPVLASFDVFGIVVFKQRRGRSAS